MKKTVTQADVAREAKTSRVTVSRVFNDPSRVGERTRQAVLNAAAKLGYVHNAFDLENKRRSQGCIALLRVDDFNPEQWSERHIVVSLYDKVIETASTRNVEVIAGHCARGERLSDVLHRYAERTDGIIIPTLTDPTEEQIAELRKCSKPIVMLNRLIPHSKIHSITFDNNLAGQEMARALLAAGHRRIAYITGTGRSQALSARLGGFISELMLAGCFEPSLIIHTKISVENGAKAAEYLLGLDSPPTAIACANDRLAYGVVLTCRNNSVPIPEALSLIGHDNLYKFYDETGSITTVDFQCHRFAELSLMILSLMAKQALSQTLNLTVPPRLVDNGTIAKLC